MKINMTIESALKHYQSGKLQLAKSVCNKILKEQPYNADILHFLGIINLELEQYDSAVKYIKKALQIKPKNAQAYFHLGNALRGKDQTEEVMSCYRKAIELNPAYSEVYNNIGNILQEKGQVNEAITYYQKAIENDKSLPDSYYNLGNAFQEIEQFDDAKAWYQKAIELDPEFTDAYYNLGYISFRERKHDEAIRCFQKVIELSPDSPEAYNYMGTALHGKGLYEEAISYYQKAITINPAFAVSYYNMGNTLGCLGKQNESIEAYDKAIQYNHRIADARWARCMAELPVVYPDEKSLQIARKRYHDALLQLCEDIPLETQHDINIAADSIGIHQPFFLPYQGLNDRDLQQIYGDLINKIMVLKYPQLVIPPAMPPAAFGKPIRVGIVSRYFCYHSNWKIPIKGWIENIDKQQFELYGYYTGIIKDKETEIARSYFNRFTEDVYSINNFCKIISSDRLHVLIFPEIGMDSLTFQLASLKLAPIQCTSWGHPETSGLPTIDYFISSELMEPPNADEHYTEKLVRLPNLSICYSPLDVQTVDIDRKALGLRPDSTLYLCSQSLFKYLPQYDEVFPEIAEQAGNCQFLFISDNSNLLTGIFWTRIYEAFKSQQLNADDYLVFLPRLEPVQYHSLNMLADIFLDSIGWSGCNSTFEAIACNLPVVTLPGNMMRGRHTSAILTMMGLKETIASSTKEYVELAVRLGKDTGYRSYISENISRNKQRIYNDKVCITALEDFLVKAVINKL
jgi:protein O-GlcNAc transferase